MKNIKRQWSLFLIIVILSNQNEYHKIHTYLPIKLFQTMEIKFLLKFQKQDRVDCSSCLLNC